MLLRQLLEADVLIMVEDQNALSFMKEPFAPGPHDPVNYTLMWEGDDGEEHRIEAPGHAVVMRSVSGEFFLAGVDMPSFTVYRQVKELSEL